MILWPLSHQGGEDDLAESMDVSGIEGSGDDDADSADRSL